MTMFYGLTENDSLNYAVRTNENVKNSCGTIRLAYNFKSRGEISTLKAIHKHRAPSLVIDLNDPIDCTVTANWIIGNGINIKIYCGKC